MTAFVAVNDPAISQPEPAPVPLQELAWELRVLCQGLSCTQVRSLETVSTVVRLPEDPAQIVKLRRICEWLANEFKLDHDVRRDGEVWAVRFTRLPAPAPFPPRPVPTGLRTRPAQTSPASPKRPAARPAVNSAPNPPPKPTTDHPHPIPRLTKVPHRSGGLGGHHPPPP